MSKKALGRGLGELLAEHGPDVAGDAAPTATEALEGAELGPGLRVLVLQKTPKAISAPPVDQESTNLGPVKISLVVADLFLLIMIFLWWRGVAVNELGFLDVFILGVGLSLGAWLASLAVWLHFRADS